VKLEYYSLEKTFEGSIMMVKETVGEYGAPKVKRPVKMVETLSPLEEVIAKINEQFVGDFTEGDRVMITALHEKLKKNKKLKFKRIFTNTIIISNQNNQLNSCLKKSE
jgi:type I restriction enzyme R subunit